MKIMWIPDTQTKEGVPTEHLEWIGKYAIDKRPDIIIHAGDHWDMPSLSSYDKGKKSFEGRRYKKDVEAGNAAMEILLKPLKDYNAQASKNHRTRYNPTKYFLTGNHEQRIERAIQDDAKLDGTIGYQDLDTSDWEVVGFLEPLVIEDVVFCHYLTSGVMGRPVTTANALLTKKHQSCVVGHQQGRQVATSSRADGRTLTAIIAGSCYLHEEDYLGVQGNKHFRGVVMLHEVADGSFDESFVSLNFLSQKYAGKEVS